MSTLLAVDIGTTTFKAYVYDEHGNALAHAVVGAPDETIEIAGVPVDVWQPDKLWECICSLIGQVVRGLPQRSIDALAVDHMGIVGAPIDQDGRALGPFVTWIDPTHTQPLVADFPIDNVTLFASTGNRCSAIYPPAWIGWMRQHSPGYADGMRWWVNPGDYVAFRLCWGTRDRLLDGVPDDLFRPAPVGVSEGFHGGLRASGEYLSATSARRHATR